MKSITNKQAQAIIVERIDEVSKDPCVITYIDKNCETEEEARKAILLIAIKTLVKN